MTRSSLEPGLLKVFRWFAIGRLGLLLLAVVSNLLPAESRVLRYPIFGIVESVLLLVVLTWPWLRDRLGRACLPLALVLASGGAIVEHALTVGLRLLQGVQGSEAMTDAWQLILVLFVPLILVAWQYSFPTVLVFVLVTTGLDFSLTVILAVAARYRAASPITVMFLRALVYGLVGYVVVQLMQAQRAQRAALAEANAQLARYATTLEQLTLSRERNRMARELHDTLAHSLSAVAVQLEATRSLWDEDPVGARGMLDRSLAMTRHGLSEARRAIRALRAIPLEDLGLALALRQAAALVAERGGLRLELAVEDSVDGLPPEVAQVVYRVAMEAMENVVRHAAANVLDVSLVEAGEHWVLTVTDDGRGFDAAGAASDRA
ncbi:MAG: hypothetical protein J7M39_15055, partial [Anaerolineae bacterium]|nr:hypothetical protein [Anaerolineae bacterium]